MKIVQIVSVESSLFALTEEGSLWEMDVRARTWWRCQDILSMEELKHIQNAILIVKLDISSRIKKALGNYGILTVGELMKVDVAELKNIPGMGDKSLFELQNALNELVSAAK